MHSSESALENEMHKFFGILQYKQIIESRPDHQTVAFPYDRWVKLKKSKKTDKYIDLAREMKKNGTWKWRWY